MRSTPVRYVIRPDQPIQWVTNATVQRTPDAVLLNLFQARPPADADGAEFFDGACLGRFVIRLDDAVRMVGDILQAIDDSRQEQPGTEARPQ